MDPLGMREVPAVLICVCTQGDATPTAKAGQPAAPQAAGEERQPVVYPEGVHRQGPEPHLPACVLQRAPVGAAEDCGGSGVC